MLGTSHSWAVTLRSLIREFKKDEHSLHLDSINGWDLIPDEWSRWRKPFESPDIDLTYTLPRNFVDRFQKSSKLKLAIYNYESSLLPIEWRDKHSHIDYALPSSNYCKEVFINNGWPEEKCIVVPLGINPDDFLDKSICNDIKTKKTFKFLNVSIPHYRKNLELLIDAYYSEFSSKDEVCLILKTDLSKPKASFECDVSQIIKAVEKKHTKYKTGKHNHKSLPSIEIITKRYSSIVPIMNSCQALISASSSEGFGLPLLEGLAANMLVIAPRCTGQLDFLSDKNSLLVDAKEINAPDKYQYWRGTPGAKIYMPEKESLSLAMRKAYNEHKTVLDSFEPAIKNTVQGFTWDIAARKILDLA